MHEATAIDPWFLDQIALVNDVGESIARAATLDDDLLRSAKRYGLSDEQIAVLRAGAGDTGLDTEEKVREHRWAAGIRPVYKTVDTCAAEFEALTPYHYSAYETDPAAESPRSLRRPSGPR